MSRRTSPKLIIASLTIAFVLLMNPGNALAGPPPPGTPVLPPSPPCTPGPDPDGAGPLTQTPDIVPILGVGGIDPGNGGSFTYNGFIPDPDGAGPQTHMMTVTENWGNSDRSYIMICGLDSGATDYQLKKIITNSDSVVWDNFDNELIDPCCSTNDILNDQPSLPYVTILGAVWSHSNDKDGLSFAMGTQDAIRTSVQFPPPPLTVNEVGTIDFINYNNGQMNPGETDNFMSYGLRESQNSEQPFILTQAPNFQTCPPGTILVGGECVPVVGGTFEGVDTTALLVAGAQMNAAWLIPLVLGIIGIGIVLAKKFRN